MVFHQFVVRFLQWPSLRDDGLIRAPALVVEGGERWQTVTKIIDSEGSPSGVMVIVPSDRRVSVLSPQEWWSLTVVLNHLLSKMIIKVTT